MEPKVVKVSDEAKITIPLKNLISIVAGVAFLVAAHYTTTNRISALESQLQKAIADVESNDNWIDNYQPSELLNQTAERLRLLEGKVYTLEERIRHIKH